jgi:prepilin-type N-terminal cleavage/methylation domain-containing protein
MRRLGLLGKGARGYSLVETLIGMVVLGIAIGSASALLIATSRLNSMNQNLPAATALAEAKLEELRNLDLANVVTGADPGKLNAQGDAGGIFSRTWTVQNNLPVTGLKTVVVAVAWTQFGGARTYTLTGVLGP